MWITFRKRYRVIYWILRLFTKQNMKNNCSMSILIIQTQNEKLTITFWDANNLSIHFHLPLSSYLALSVFFLFGYLEYKCKGHKFTSVDELIYFINEIFMRLKKKFYSAYSMNEKKECINILLQKVFIFDSLSNYAKHVLVPFR